MEKDNDNLASIYDVLSINFLYLTQHTQFLLDHIMSREGIQKTVIGYYTTMNNWFRFRTQKLTFLAIS